MKHLIALLSFGIVAACTQSMTETPANNTSSSSIETMDHSKIITGNGEKNFIILDGTSRNGSTFTFPEVTIDKDGFLVMHPFKDGKPVQTEYVGAVPVATGTHKNVAITIDRETNPGDNFIVMLHYDMNTDKIFDFNDGVTVPDAPVFEGRTLVALRYKVQ